MRHKLKALLLLAIVGIGMMAWPLHTTAATGVVYVSPSSDDVQVGSNTTLGLRINPGTDVDYVWATVSFDTASLQLLSVDTSSSAFPVEAQKDISSGTITLALSNQSGGVNSDSLIANMSFKALVSSGNTSVTLSGVNASYSGSYTSPSSADGTVNFTPVPPSSSASGSSGSSGGSSSKKTTTTTPAPTTTTETPAATKVTPTISVSKLQYSKASIVVSTNVAAQVALKYGSSPTELDLMTEYSVLGTKNTINLDDDQLTPGTDFYYKVLTKDSAGTVTTSELKTFKTEGYTLKVTVLDSKNKPLKGKDVTLHSQPLKAKTDSKGVATFTGVAPGWHNVLFSPSKFKIYQQKVYVSNTVTNSAGVETAAPQVAAVVMAGLTQSSIEPLQTVLTILAILIVFAGACLLIMVTPLRSIIVGRMNLFKHTMPPLGQPPVISPSG